MQMRSEKEIGMQLDVLYYRLHENNLRHQQLLQKRKDNLIKPNEESEIIKLAVQKAVIEGQIQMLEFVFGIEDLAVA